MNIGRELSFRQKVEILIHCGMVLAEITATLLKRPLTPNEDADLVQTVRRLRALREVV